MLAFANIEAYRFDDPEKEARYQTLISELRCVVCVSQNIADSNAELAQDLRRQTYEMIQQGASNEEIVTFMVQRYGDFVLYRPPLKPSTMLLWVGPFIIFTIGLVVLVVFIRRRNQEPEVELSSEDHARAQSLLDDDDEHKPN
jgi:cytochrome c-type biogenesis protein CcmH